MNLEEEGTVKEDEKNFDENKFLHLYDEAFDPADLTWFDRTLYLANLDLTSADTTVQVARILLKMFSVYTLRETNRMIYTRSVSYNMSNRMDIAERLVNEMEFVLIGEHLDDQIFANNDMIVLLFDNGYMNCFSGSPKFNNEVFNGLNNLFRKPSEPEPNRAYILESSHGVLEFKPWVIKERPLIEDNYSEDVTDNLERLYSVVQDENPLGRLAILEGPPGGGKSSLLRGLMHKYPNSKFCIIPPFLVSQIGSPSMISAVIRFQVNDPRPFVLVLEDADEAIVKRDAGNVHNISAVLNLADGIVSDTFDVRVVATTNKERTEIDPALIRPGRLGCYIRFGDITKKHARRIYQRLTKDATASLPEEVSSKSVIMLSDVYAATKELELIKVPDQKRRRVGF